MLGDGGCWWLHGGECEDNKALWGWRFGVFDFFCFLVSLAFGVWRLALGVWSFCFPVLVLFLLLGVWSLEFLLSCFLLFLEFGVWSFCFLVFFFSFVFPFLLHVYLTLVYLIPHDFLCFFLCLFVNNTIE